MTKLILTIATAALLTGCIIYDERRPERDGGMIGLPPPPVLAGGPPPWAPAHGRRAQITQPPYPVAAQSPGYAQPVPSRAIVEACNKYANNQVTSRSSELVKDGGIGAVIGATVGAVGGAIAGGGKGAGKGAAIGGLVGVTGGALYGMNENKANDEKYRVAYTSCMHSNGYPG